MKLWRVIFPFRILFGILFLYSTLAFAQTKATTTPSQEVLDSLAQQYALSKNKSLSLPLRLRHVSSFLKGVVLYQQDSLIYNGLMQKTWLLGKVQQFDSAIVYSHQLYDLAKKNRDTLYIRKSLKKLKLYYQKDNKFISTFQFYNEDFKISRIKNDTIRTGKSLLQMANIQAILGDYSGSKATAIDGLRYIENTIDIRSLSGLYHIISVANIEQGNYEEALKYNTETLALGKDSISKSLIRPQSILKFKNTKANILANLGDYNKAISILSKLTLDTIVQKDKREYARVLGNLGYIQWLENIENDNSENLLLESRDIRNDINDIQGLIASNIHLTKYYLKKDKTKALQYAEEAYQNAKELNSLTSILESLGFIFQLKEDITKEAKVYDKVHQELQEINQSNREIYAVTKYENDKLTNENLILKAEQVKKERQRIINLLVTLVVILLAGLVFYLLRQRYKREKIRDVFNAEARISKKIHDELANDVYNVMVQIQNNQENYEVLDKLENIYERTRDISRENSSFDTGSNFWQELNSMISSYGTAHTQIMIKDIDLINWQSITPEKKIIIHRILQELMVNMKKHSKASLVAISFKETSKTIGITYADTGVGVSKNELIYSSGLRNAENRIKIIGGSFIFDSEIGKGFRANIHFPN